MLKFLKLENNILNESYFMKIDIPFIRPVFYRRFAKRMVEVMNKSLKKNRCAYTDQEICEFIGVSNVTFSRQMNSNKLDSAFLHKYLVSAGIIPESVTEPLYDSLEAFISLYPDQYQKQIKAFFERN